MIVSARDARGPADQAHLVQTAQVLSERYGPAYRWLVTITGMVGVVSMVLAMTTVNVAVPDVMGAFGIGQDQAQWMSSAYMATMTAGMLINAWLTGVLGERRTFVGSLFFFSVGALLGGSAPTEDMPDLRPRPAGLQRRHRAAAGDGDHLHRLPGRAARHGDGRVRPRRRVRAGDRPDPGRPDDRVLLLALRLLHLAAVLRARRRAWACCSCRRRPMPRRIPPFDWLGFALLCTALLGLMTGIADGQREGWSSDTIVLRLAVGAVAGVAFVFWELHTPRAMLDIRIFANIEFSAAALIAFIFGAGMMGSTYVMPVFVQTIIGFTPLLAGLMMMPAGIMLAFIFPLAGRLADAIPASTMIIAGLLLFSAGFALMAWPMSTRPSGPWSAWSWSRASGSASSIPASTPRR